MISQRIAVAAIILLVLGTGCGEAVVAAEGPSVPVLVYHRIVAPGEPVSNDIVRADLFQAQMQHLADEGWNTVSMDELVAYMRGSPLPARSVAIHFDDGWKSQLSALPILRQHGFKATFWIFPGKGIGDPYLDWDEVRKISSDASFEVQSHTMTHPWDAESNLLSWLDGSVPGRAPADAVYELRMSKQQLEEQLGEPVRYLAWPMGWYNDRLVALAKSEGYEALATIDEGGNRRGDDVLRIKRLSVHGACDLAAFVELLETLRLPSCAR